MSAQVLLLADHARKHIADKHAIDSISASICIALGRLPSNL
jgi:hypothetical protein